jgi:aminoglycoside phosphotransferase (APT) family kinase protein
MTRDPRCHPSIDLDLGQIRAMLSPILGDAGIREAVPVEGGLINTLYRVTLDRRDEVYALRVYAGGRDAFERERRVLSHLATAGALPVPEVLLAGASGGPCLVYRWIEGITLNEFRRQSTLDVLLTIAEPLGRILARIASFSFPDLPEIQVANELAQTDEQLRTGLARERLGGELADHLRGLLAGKDLLFEHGRGLVHGDLGGRNILVEQDEREISGVIDWETAAAGSALWDVGSLFRYSRRYSPEFRKRFEQGYRAGGGELPRDWWRTARLLDATRLVGILNEERELPGVFAECRELIEYAAT